MMFFRFPLGKSAIKDKRNTINSLSKTILEQLVGDDETGFIVSHNPYNLRLQFPLIFAFSYLTLHKKNAAKNFLFTFEIIRQPLKEFLKFSL